MKILLAFDSFKGSFSAAEVCEIVKGGLERRGDEFEVEVLPLADGGDGTAEVVLEHLGGEYVEVGKVYGPLEEIEVAGRYIELAGNHGSLIEMAVASGIKLLPSGGLEAMTACSYGTGQMICHAMQRGYATIYLTLGGSATTDGGACAAAALGWQFLDDCGEEVRPCGGKLLEICRVIKPLGMERWPRVEALCDVDNPLLGAYGAARIYGPQKGADDEMVKRLEAGLTHLAGLMKEQHGMDFAGVKGAGAAGGFGFGAMTFFGARLVSGTETILRWMGFAEKAKAADWVITGEGCIDQTSFQGKLISGVIEKSIANGAKVGLLAGRMRCDDGVLKGAGVSLVEACAGVDIDDARAMGEARELLSLAAGRLADRLALGM